MEYKSKPTGRPSDFYVFGLVVTGIVFWTLPMLESKLTALYQLIAILMFSAGMYLLIRYRLTVFTFVVEGRNGDVVDIRTAMPSELDFVVKKMRGNNPMILARLSLDELKSVETVRYSEVKEKSAGASLFKYHANMSPEETVLVVFGGDDRDIAMTVDLSAEMMTFLGRITESNLGGYSSN